MNPTDLIKIELTSVDAMYFKKFREHQDDFQLLYDAGVFCLKNGKAILSFNVEGVLCDIDFDIKGYKRGFPMLQILKFDL